jgi:hypothetical protein
MFHDKEKKPMTETRTASVYPSEFLKVTLKSFDMLRYKGAIEGQMHVKL